MQFKMIKKAAFLSLGLALAPAVSPIMTPALSNALVASAKADDTGLILLLLLTTTFASGGVVIQFDQSKAQSLLDEAAACRGDKVELLARSSGRAVEDVCDTLVSLEKRGKIDASKPAEMVEVVKAALAK